MLIFLLSREALIRIAPGERNPRRIRAAIIISAHLDYQVTSVPFYLAFYQERRERQKISKILEGSCLQQSSSRCHSIRMSPRQPPMETVITAIRRAIAIPPLPTAPTISRMVKMEGGIQPIHGIWIWHWILIYWRRIFWRIWEGGGLILAPKG